MLEFKLARVWQEARGGQLEGRRERWSRCWASLALTPELRVRRSVKMTIDGRSDCPSPGAQEETLWAAGRTARRRSPAAIAGGERASASPPAGAGRPCSGLEELDLLECLLAELVGASGGRSRFCPPNQIEHPGLGSTHRGAYIALHAEGVTPGFDSNPLTRRLDGDTLCQSHGNAGYQAGAHPDRPAPGWNQLLKDLPRPPERPAKRELHNQLHVRRATSPGPGAARQQVLQNRPGEIQFSHVTGPRTRVGVMD